MELELHGPAIGFGNGKPNINGETEGSTLTIYGTGSLYAEGSSGIGGGGSGSEESRGKANNIIINSGTITTKCSGGTGVAIGNNNIIINGGTITALSSKNSAGIGSYNGIVDNITINGGHVIATGGEYSGAIGGGSGSGKVIITGGIIELSSASNSAYSLLGMGFSDIEITGGTVIVDSSRHDVAIGTKDITNNIEIKGGSIRTYIRKEVYAIPPTSGVNNVYLTELQLQNVTEEVEITSFTTSDNIDYGIKNMYTTTEGKLYVYLPTGERTITIKAGEKEYTGTVTTGTSDATESVTLVEK